MFIQQLYTNCLAQAAYYVESGGEALIIDPLRDPEPYISLAKTRGATIRYVFETHFHADFVSGHVELARQTGAVIVYGPGAKPRYEALIAEDGEKFVLGNVQIELIHTPGHTVESSCFLLYNEHEEPYCLFTGDTLFAGDVGRPDLLSGNLSKEILAGMLFDSLQKLKGLPDKTIVYPGHGAGSACGKNIGKETQTSLGEQREKNYALKENDREKFIALLTDGLPVPPAYFFKDAAMNISGYDSYEQLISKENKALNLHEFKNEISNGTVILDTRPAHLFSSGFVPGSINIGLDGDFAVWAGTLIPFNTPIVLITEPGREKEGITRLARIGYDTIKGFLAGGFVSWLKAGLETDLVKNVNMETLLEMQDEYGYRIIDVRNVNEAFQKRVKTSLLIPLSTIDKSTVEHLDKNETYVIYCAGGYRSMIAASLFKKYGIKNIRNLESGINAYKLPMEA